MKSLWISLVLFILSGLLMFVPSPCPGRDVAAPMLQSTIDGQPTRTTASVISQAAARGDLSRADELLYRAYSLYAPELLPEAYRGNVIDKCGTATAREIWAALDELPPEVADDIRGRAVRPTCDTHYDTAHFRIHFDTAGEHMILNWPDTAYRDSVAAALEKSWEDEVTGLGFRAPPNDGGDPDGGGGNSLYDVYLQNCSGYYGYTQGSYTVPSTPRSDCTSWIVIDNDYAGFGYPDPTDPMKVTVAHEFCHACQFSSNCWADLWYMECTSVWAEDVVFDDINDYRGYIPYYLNYPYASIEWQDGSGLRMYGSCVWNFFLTEAVATGIVPAIWSRLEYTSNETSAFDYCLGLEGTCLEDAYSEYAVWNWFTDTRDDGAHYDEGADWPLVPTQRVYSSYPVVAGSPPLSYRPDHLAWNYIQFSNPGGADEALSIAYSGPLPTACASHVFVNTNTSEDLKSEYCEVAVDGTGHGNGTVFDWYEMSLAAVVVVNASTNQNDMNYTLDVDTCTPVAGSVYAVADRNSVTLRWTLARPGDVVSLQILRQTGGSDFEPLNDIPLEPVSPGSFVDTDVRPGEELRYRLVATLWDGSTDVVGQGEVSVRIDGQIGLAMSPPAPNPFSQRVNLEFSLPDGGARARLMVHDVAGRLVATLEDGWLAEGRHSASWDGRDERGRAVASGVYFCTLELPDAVVARKVMLLR